MDFVATFLPLVWKLVPQMAWVETCFKPSKSERIILLLNLARFSSSRASWYVWNTLDFYSDVGLESRTRTRLPFPVLSWSTSFFPGKIQYCTSSRPRSLSSKHLCNCNSLINPPSALLNFWFFRKITHNIINPLVCLTNVPKHLPKRVLHRMRSSASSFNLQYSFSSLRLSSSYLCLLPCFSVTSILPSIFPSITCFEDIS